MSQCNKQYLPGINVYSIGKFPNGEIPVSNAPSGLSRAIRLWMSHHRKSISFLPLIYNQVYKSWLSRLMFKAAHFYRVNCTTSITSLVVHVAFPNHVWTQAALNLQTPDWHEPKIKPAVAVPGVVAFCHYQRSHRESQRGAQLLWKYWKLLRESEGREFPRGTS